MRAGLVHFNLFLTHITDGKVYPVPVETDDTGDETGVTVESPGFVDPREIAYRQRLHLDPDGARDNIGDAVKRETVKLGGTVLEEDAVLGVQLRQEFKAKKYWQAGKATYLWYELLKAVILNNPVGPWTPKTTIW